MDEILIGDKKYVSSKRAAKITGYAKDYVGQLCREGRVPARLVGRSWYVLESAIQDHRFAEKNIDQETKVSASSADQKNDSGPGALPTWETPRYETTSGEVLPPIHRIEDTNVVGQSTEDEGKLSQYLQESWRAWFEHVGSQPEQVTPEEEKVEIEASQEELKNNNEEEAGQEGGDVSVPVHVMYEPPPEEFLPIRSNRRKQHEEERDDIAHESKVKGTKLALRAVQLIGIVAALVLVVFAVVGSGILDGYIVSINQDSFITGIKLYNK